MDSVGAPEGRGKSNNQVNERIRAACPHAERLGECQ